MELLLVYILLIIFYKCDIITSYHRINNIFHNNYKLHTIQLDKSLDISINSFSLSTSVILAGYSFEAYNEPIIGGKTVSLLDNKITYQSTDYIRKVYKGLVIITLISGKFQYTESQLLEQIATGIDPDPYVRFSVINKKSDRIIDSAKSTVKNNQKECIWKENFYLYVKNIEDNVIYIEAYDEDTLKSDDFIGSNNITISNLLMLKDNNNFIPVSIPLYTDTTSDSPVGSLSTEMLYIPWADSQPNLEMMVNRESSLPRGGSPQLVDWRLLLSQISDQYERIDAGNTIDKNEDSSVDRSKSSTQSVNRIEKDSIHSKLLLSAQLKGLHQICQIENIQTDTQLSIWADDIRKQIIISFRGTEQVKFRDILTDINVIQSDYNNDINELIGVKVHSGFHEAFRSVYRPLFDIIESLLTAYSDNKPSTNWDVFITGHSLGAALATLASFELGLMRSGIIDTCSNELKAILMNTNIITYTYGAPRVGNALFVKIYNELLPNNFRIVNNKDVVCRMPRGADAVRLTVYEHVGRTVVIDDNQLGLLWIEGQSTGSCPLTELSPIKTVDSNTNTNTSYNDLLGTFNNINIDIDKQISFVNGLQKYIYDGLQSAQSVSFTIRSIGNNSLFELPEFMKSISLTNYTSIETFNQIQELYNNITDSNNLLNMSLSNDFITKEWELFNALIDGTAVAHHLEPSYYQALAKIIFDKNNKI